MIRFFFNFAMFFFAAVCLSVQHLQPTVNYSNIKPYRDSNDFRPELSATETVAFPSVCKMNPGNGFMTSPSYMKIRYINRSPTDIPGFIANHLLNQQKEFHINYQPNRM